MSGHNYVVSNQSAMSGHTYVVSNQLATSGHTYVVSGTSQAMSGHTYVVSREHAHYFLESSLSDEAELDSRLSQAKQNAVCSAGKNSKVSEASGTTAKIPVASNFSTCSRTISFDPSLEIQNIPTVRTGTQSEGVPKTSALSWTDSESEVPNDESEVPKTSALSWTDSESPFRATQSLHDRKTPFRATQSLHESSVSDSTAAGFKRLSLYFSNMTCYGPQAKTYMYSEQILSNDILMFVEHHLLETDKFNILSDLKKWGYTVYFTPAQLTHQSESGTHGGELIAIKFHLQQQSIDCKVWDYVQRVTGLPIRFAAAILRLKKVSILLIAAYFWDGEGLSGRNDIIFRQIQMLRQILGLDFLAVADFNMSPDAIRQSHWPSLLQAGSLCTGESTFKGSASSELDHALVSHNLVNIMSSPVPDLGTPWKHLGLNFHISSRPRQFQAPVFLVPKPLPFEEATLKWVSLNKFEQYQSYVKTRKKGQKHSCSTGTKNRGCDFRVPFLSPGPGPKMPRDKSQCSFVSRRVLSARVLVSRAFGVAPCRGKEN